MIRRVSGCLVLILGMMLPPSVAHASGSYFGCSADYLADITNPQPDEPLWSTVCDVAVSAGAMDLLFGWKPASLAYARLTIATGSSVYAEIFCDVVILGSCSMKTNVAGARFFMRPVAPGDAVNQIEAQIPLPTSARLILELAPHGVGVGACAPEPVLGCLFSFAGFGRFHAYGIAGE